MMRDADRKLSVSGPISRQKFGGCSGSSDLVSDLNHGGWRGKLGRVSRSALRRGRKNFK